MTHIFSGFNVAINDTTPRGSVDELTNLNELRQLEVQSLDSFNYFINRRTGRTLIQRESHKVVIDLPGRCQSRAVARAPSQPPIMIPRFKRTTTARPPDPIRLDS